MLGYIMMTVARGMAYDLDGNFFYNQADLIAEPMTRGRGAFATLRNWARLPLKTSSKGLRKSAPSSILAALRR